MDPPKYSNGQKNDHDRNKRTTLNASQFANVEAPSEIRPQNTIDPRLLDVRTSTYAQSLNTMAVDSSIDRSPLAHTYQPTAASVADAYGQSYGSGMNYTQTSYGQSEWTGYHQLSVELHEPLPDQSEDVLSPMTSQLSSEEQEQALLSQQEPSIRSGLPKLLPKRDAPTSQNRTGSSSQHRTGSLCDICGQLLPPHVTWDQHRAKHGEDFICQTCGSRFDTLRKFNTHRETHLPKSTRKLYACEYTGCEKAYVRKSGLLEHKRKHHGWENPSGGSDG